MALPEIALPVKSLPARISIAPEFVRFLWVNGSVATGILFLDASISSRSFQRVRVGGSFVIRPLPNPSLRESTRVNHEPSAQNADTRGFYADRLDHRRRSDQVDVLYGGVALPTRWHSKCATGYASAELNRDIAMQLKFEA